MVIKQCKICGVDFETGGNGKVCPSCRRGPCSICGKEIEYSQYQLKQLMTGNGVSCSGKCRAELTRRNLMEREGIENVSQRESLAHRRYKRTCKLCGGEFEGGRAANYCPECKTVTCPVCGKEFVPSPPHFSRYLKQGWLTCGDNKCRVEMTRRNLLGKEGVGNVSQLESVREKLKEARLNDSEDTKARRSESIRAAYADGSVIEQRKATCREKYGVDSALALPEVYEKGVAAAKAPEARAKAQETHAKNHNGAKTPFQRSDVIAATIARRNEKRAAEAKRVVDYVSEHPDLPGRTIARKLGMKYHTLMAYNRDFDIGIKLHRSATEQEFAELLDERGVDYERDHGFEGEGKYRYDFWIGNVVVEIDPTYTHNSTHGTKFGGIEGEPKLASYHKDKSAFAAARGYRCIHVFDWDDMEKVADMFIDKRRILEDGYSIRVIEGMDRQVLEFLDKYHLQNRCGGIDFSVCAFEGDLLVGVMAFGKPRFAKRFDLELLRYCVKPDVMLEFGARRLFATATLHTPQKTIVSYCDMAKFDGGVYERLGFELDGTTSPSPVWFNEKTGKMFRNSYVLQRGVDQLLGTSYGKGADNRELMLLEGFVEVYDCGQSRWTYAN